MLRRRPPLLTSRGRWLLVAGLAMCAAGILLGYHDVTRVGLLVVMITALAYAVVRRPVPQMVVRRSVEPSRLHPGEAGHVQVDFTNVSGSRTPLYLAEERLAYALGDRPRFTLTGMRSGESRRLQYAIRSHTRGRHRLGPVALRARDPFGLAHVNLVLNASDHVLVLPQVEPLGTLPLARSIGNEGDVPFMVALQGQDDTTVRAYREGDDLRHVHWPATAHRGELMVRQEDRPARRRAVLLLDPRAAAHGGEPSSPTFEWCVAALASIGHHLLLQGFDVHLVTQEAGDELSAARQVDLDGLLTTLAEAETAREPLVSLEGLARAAHVVSAGGALVVAALADQDPDAFRTVAQIREHGGMAMGLVCSSGRITEDSRARTLADILTLAGWRTCVVGPEQPLAQVWLELNVRSISAGA